VNNEGFDSVATHNKGLKTRFITNFDVSQNVSFKFPEHVEINPDIQGAFLNKMGLRNRILNRIRELLFS